MESINPAADLHKHMFTNGRPNLKLPESRVNRKQYLPPNLTVRCSRFNSELKT